MVAFSKHSTCLSFQCDVASVNTPVINGEFLSCSVDAGLVLGLALHHEDLAVLGFL